MDVASFLPLPDGLMIEQIEATGTHLIVVVQATAAVACCPVCQVAASHVHSHSRRRVADPPCGGRQVVLQLSVRRFFCLNLACTRRIFTERLTPLIEPWARKTTRLIAALRALGEATSGEAGARLAPHVGMTASPATMLRQIKSTPCPIPETVTKVGIDDFAWRRGVRYGTILVDLDTHRVVDLLPDRSAATATAWFQAHPQIELVSRDRGTDYTAAAREGAPQARQIADRWHLLHTLSEVVIEVLTRHLPQIRKASRALVAPSTPEPEQELPKEPAPAGDEEPLTLRLGRP